MNGIADVLSFCAIAVLVMIICRTRKFNRESGFQFFEEDEDEGFISEDNRPLTYEEKLYIQCAVDSLISEMKEGHELKTYSMIIQNLNDLLINGIEDNGVTVQQLIRMYLKGFDILPEFDSIAAKQAYIENHRNYLLKIPFKDNKKGSGYFTYRYKYYIFEESSMKCTRRVSAEQVERMLDENPDRFVIIEDQLHPELMAWYTGRERYSKSDTHVY